MGTRVAARWLRIDPAEDRAPEPMLPSVAPDVWLDIAEGTDANVQDAVIDQVAACAVGGPVVLEALPAPNLTIEAARLLTLRHDVVVVFIVLLSRVSPRPAVAPMRCARPPPPNAFGDLRVCPVEATCTKCAAADETWAHFQLTPGRSPECWPAYVAAARSRGWYVHQARAEVRRVEEESVPVEGQLDEDTCDLLDAAQRLADAVADAPPPPVGRVPLPGGVPVRLAWIGAERPVRKVVTKVDDSAKSEILLAAVFKAVAAGHIAMVPEHRLRAAMLMFVVEKDGAAPRACVSPEEVNELLEEARVCYDGAEETLDYFADYATKLDYKDAFPTLEMDDDDCVFLGIIIEYPGRWRVALMIRRLWFGLRNGPKSFVRALDASVRWLRLTPRSTRAYMDDVLRLANTPVDAVLRFLSAFVAGTVNGFWASVRKAFAFPAFIVKYLGVLIDLLRRVLRVSRASVTKTALLLDRLVGEVPGEVPQPLRPEVLARLRTVGGKLAFYSAAVPMVKLLRLGLNRAIRDETWTEELVTDLRFWQGFAEKLPEINHPRVPLGPYLMVFFDSSSSTSGGVYYALNYPAPFRVLYLDLSAWRLLLTSSAAFEICAILAIDLLLRPRFFYRTIVAIGDPRAAYHAVKGWKSRSSAVATLLLELWTRLYLGGPWPVSLLIAWHSRWAAHAQLADAVSAAGAATVPSATLAAMLRLFEDFTVDLCSSAANVAMARLWLFAGGTPERAELLQRLLAVTDADDDAPRLPSMFDPAGHHGFLLLQPAFDHWHEWLLANWTSFASVTIAVVASSKRFRFLRRLPPAQRVWALHLAELPLESHDGGRPDLSRSAEVPALVVLSWGVPKPPTVSECPHVGLPGRWAPLTTLTPPCGCLRVRMRTRRELELERLRCGDGYVYIPGPMESAVWTSPRGTVRRLPPAVVTPSPPLRLETPLLRRRARHSAGLSDDPASTDSDAAADATPVVAVPCMNACGRMIDRRRVARFCDEKGCPKTWQVCRTCVPARHNKVVVLCPAHQVARALVAVVIVGEGSDDLKATSIGTVGRLVCRLLRRASAPPETVAAELRDHPLTEEDVRNEVLRDAFEAVQAQLWTATRRKDVCGMLYRILQLVKAIDALDEPIGAVEQVMVVYAARRLDKPMPGWHPIRAPALKTEASSFASIARAEGARAVGAYAGPAVRVYLGHRGAFAIRTNTRRYPVTTRMLWMARDRVPAGMEIVWDAAIWQSFYVLRAGIPPVLMVVDFWPFAGGFIAVFRRNHKTAKLDKADPKAMPSVPHCTAARHPLLTEIWSRAPKSGRLFPGVTAAAVTKLLQHLFATDLPEGFDLNAHCIRVGGATVLEALRLSKDQIGAHVGWARTRGSAGYYASLPVELSLAFTEMMPGVDIEPIVPGCYRTRSLGVRLVPDWDYLLRSLPVDDSGPWRMGSATKLPKTTESEDDDDDDMPVPLDERQRRVLTRQLVEDVPTERLSRAAGPQAAPREGEAARAFMRGGQCRRPGPQTHLGKKQKLHLPPDAIASIQLFADGTWSGTLPSVSHPPASELDAAEEVDSADDADDGDVRADAAAEGTDVDSSSDFVVDDDDAEIADSEECSVSGDDRPNPRPQQPPAEVAGPAGELKQALLKFIASTTGAASTEAIDVSLVTPTLQRPRTAAASTQTPVRSGAPRVRPPGSGGVRTPARPARAGSTRPSTVPSVTPSVRTGASRRPAREAVRDGSARVPPVATRRSPAVPSATPGAASAESGRPSTTRRSVPRPPVAEVAVARRRVTSVVTVASTPGSGRASTATAPASVRPTRSAAGAPARGVASVLGRRSADGHPLGGSAASGTGSSGGGAAAPPVSRRLTFGGTESPAGA